MHWNYAQASSKVRRLAVSVDWRYYFWTFLLHLCQCPSFQVGPTHKAFFLDWPDIAHQNSLDLRVFYDQGHAEPKIQGLGKEVACSLHIPRNS